MNVEFLNILHNILNIKDIGYKGYQIYTYTIYQKLFIKNLLHNAKTMNISIQYHVTYIQFCV